MGVFIDDLVRVEFHLEEAAVSLVSMGEQIDLTSLHVSVSCNNRTLGLWGDTHSHPCERVGQPGSERLEGFDRLSGMVIFRIRAHGLLLPSQICEKS